MTILPETWYCEGCDEPHATETAAADCCGLPPAFGYLCPICGLGFECESDALECCDLTLAGGARRRWRA